MKKPNILLIISDEHRADISSFENNGIVRMPNLKGLSDKGTYFRSAYCTSSVCVPSRQSFLAGKMPRTIGCRQFGDPFDSAVTTIPGHFAANGYHTVAFGKMHFEDLDQMHGWMERPMGDIYTKRALAFEGDDSDKALNEMRKSKGCGKWPFADEVKKARVITEDQGRLGWDMRVTDEACRYLEDYFLDSNYDRPMDERPLLFCLSLNQPHYPFQCTKELLEYYLARVTPYIDSPPDNHPCYDQYSIIPHEEVTEREILRATAAYYGQVELMDNMVGKVIETIEKCDRKEDFIIVYLSDHGEMLGQYGCWEKKQYFEGSVRVPFFIADPRQEQVRQSDEVVSLLDLFPTLCDLAEIPVPVDLEGESMTPLLKGASSDWHNEALSELWSFYHGGQGSYMIRKDNMKYIHYYHDDYPDQLFDLDEDPREQKNLVHDSRYKETHKRMSELGHKRMPRID